MLCLDIFGLFDFMVLYPAFKFKIANYRDWNFYNYNHHRLHHDRNHTNYNFGQFTIIWDKLFGTYKNPVLLKKIKFDSLIDTCPQQISWFRSYKELYKSLFIILKFIKNKISSFFLYM